MFKSFSFIQNSEEGMYNELWERPGSNPGPWGTKWSAWPLCYSPGDMFDL